MLVRLCIGHPVTGPAGVLDEDTSNFSVSLGACFSLGFEAFLCCLILGLRIPPRAAPGPGSTFWAQIYRLAEPVSLVDVRHRIQEAERPTLEERRALNVAPGAGVAAEAAYGLPVLPLPIPVLVVDGQDKLGNRRRMLGPG